MPSILVVSEIFYPEGGGAEKATYLVLEILARHGFKITVFTGSEKPAVIPGVEYYITPYLKHTNRVVKFARLELLANGRFFTNLLSEHEVLYIPLYAYPLIPVAKKKGLHVVVHVHNYMPVRYSSVKYFFEPDTVNIYDELKLAVFHEYHVQRSLQRTLLFPLSFAVYLLNRKQVEKADRLVCVSKRQAEIIVKTNPRLLGKVEVIYNPIPPELLNYKPNKEPEDTPTFMYAGGDSHVKGFHILMQALNKLGIQGVKARFIFIGEYSSESLETLKRLSRKYKSLNIQVLGRVEHGELAELYKKAWALLFPSIHEEPSPYAILEAMLAGTIPVASSLGGIPELLSGAIAQQYMISPGNVISLIEKVTKICSLSVNDVKALGYKLRWEVLEKLDPSKTEKKILEIFGDAYES